MGFVDAVLFGAFLFNSANSRETVQGIPHLLISQPLVYIYTNICGPNRERIYDT